MMQEKTRLDESCESSISCEAIGILIHQIKSDENVNY